MCFFISWIDNARTDIPYWFSGFPSGIMSPVAVGYKLDGSLTCPTFLSVFLELVLK